MLKQVWTVFRKEMKCIFRDKKTFIVGLIIPLMLVPCMLFLIDFSTKSAETKTSSNVNVGINNNDNSFYHFCKAQNNVTVVDVSNPTDALNSEKISAYINVDEDIDNKILEKKDYNISAEYNESSMNSMMSSRIINGYIDAYKHLMGEVIIRYKVESPEQLIKIAAVLNLGNQDEQQGMNVDTSSIYFNMLVPMMLILYCCVGSASTASDLSAGEKERGTFESLLSTGANRTSIIMGKLMATTMMGIMSGLCTVLGLWGYLLVSSSSSSISMSFWYMITFLVVIVFTSMFFAAVNLAIGVYSRSYKEAQTYLVPVVLICQIPTMATYMLSVGDINITYLSIPILNIVCIIKEIFSGALVLSHAFIVIGWLIVYTAAAFFITSRMFKKESVVFRI